MHSNLDYLYTDALHSLSAGHVDGITRKILSFSPLPSGFIDPYASEQCSPIDAINLTYNALSVWIEQAKKCDYFRQQFVQLSKMILNSSETMARGLISLHNRGEDLSISPMSIEDLLDVASYHFRKSYLGMMQTVESRPEVSRRLLENQIRWMNMLLRLYRTKDKLSEKVKASALPEAKVITDTALPTGSGKPVPSAEAVAPAGSIGAFQAFRPLDDSKAVPARNEKTHEAAPEVRRNNTAGKNAEKTGSCETGTVPEKQETVRSRAAAGPGSSENEDPDRHGQKTGKPEAIGRKEGSDPDEISAETLTETASESNREKLISISLPRAAQSFRRFPFQRDLNDPMDPETKPPP